MSLFDRASTDAAYDRWLEPAAGHEVDDCLDCHEAGDHDDRPLNYFEVCDRCARQVADKATHATFEMRFTAADVDAALSWARANKFRYDKEPVELLLRDAFMSNVIKPQRFESI